MCVCEARPLVLDIIIAQLGFVAHLNVNTAPTSSKRGSVVQEVRIGYIQVIIVGLIESAHTDSSARSKYALILFEIRVCDRNLIIIGILVKREESTSTIELRCVVTNSCVVNSEYVVGGVIKMSTDCTPVALWDVKVGASIVDV